MKNFKKLTVLFLALFVFAGMMSCDMNSGSDELAVIGTWDNGFNNTMEITSSSYKISYPESVYDGVTYPAGSYSGKIISYDNTGWNGSDIGDGEYGYFVIQWDNPSNPANKDQFTVVRWENLKTVNGKTTMDYSEGFNSTTYKYFDTAVSAIEGATEKEGYFKKYSGTTKLK